ncbi:MAG: histidine phosphatase family protein [Desulfobacterales bacterium]|nr:histidine phosphatase family protein [Desulfobacterales bacterium]
MILLGKMPGKLIAAAWAGMMLLLSSAGAADSDRLAGQLAQGGRVLMIRHAYAPGSGDPAGFAIGDCATQRSLNEQGRSQARAIGIWLRGRGVSSARVYSSQWCRCLETAELIGLGPVTELSALNSFFQRPKDREPNLGALRTFLAEQPVDGELIVLVTHFVTISAIAGEGVSSGEGVVLQLDGEGGFDVMGRIGFDS